MRLLQARARVAFVLMRLVFNVNPTCSHVEFLLPLVSVEAKLTHARTRVLSSFHLSFWLPSEWMHRERTSRPAHLP
jgi:hypothetical protein